MNEKKQVAVTDASHIADEAIAEFLQAAEVGKPLNRTEFVRNNNSIRPALESFFEAYDQMEGNLRPSGKGGSFATGRQLGRYNLVRPIGSGSFGTVWLGFDSQLKRPVAIKVPNNDRFSNRNQRELFLSEAQAVAQLEHPNIVPIYDVGETDAEEIYLVSRFVAGNDLATETQNRRCSFRESANCVAQIANALEYAHGRNLIHRDVKPSNILVDAATRQPFITDFGLASISDDQSENSIVGTPAYMSPEQASGKMLDHRSDLFSLGVVFFELLSGVRPFNGNSAQAVMKSVREDTPAFPSRIIDSIPGALKHACLKSLSKSFDDRYGSVAELQSDLRSYLATANTNADHTGEPQQVVTSSQSKFDRTNHDFNLDTLPMKGQTLARRVFAFDARMTPVLAVVGAIAIGAFIWLALPREPLDKPPRSELNLTTPLVSMDRKIAEKTIQLGGHIDFRHQGEDFEVYSVDAIPDGVITLQWVMFNRQTIDDQFLASLQSLKNLVGVDLHNCEFSLSGVSKLADVTSLEYVYIAKTKANDAVVKSLARLPLLKDLNLSESNISSGSMQELENCETVNKLRLSETQISDESLKYIGTMKNLVSLDLSDCHISDEGVMHLGSLTNLRAIELDQTKITHKTFTHLESCPLQWIVIPAALAKSEAELTFLTTHPECKVFRK